MPYLKIQANVFFTFFGMEAINLAHYEHIKVATVGNPGLHIPTMLGGLPGVSSLVTHQMEKKMAELDIPPVPEFIQLLADSGAKLYACKASVDMFDLTRDDFIEDLEGGVVRRVALAQCPAMARGRGAASHCHAAAD